MDGIFTLDRAEIETMIANGYIPISIEQCLFINKRNIFFSICY